MANETDVEQVARAIIRVQLKAWPAWKDCTPEQLEADVEKHWRGYVPQAEAALAAMGERGAASPPDEPRPKHLCQMIRDGLAAGACLAIAEPDEDGFLARSLILPADEVEEMLRLAEGTGATQALADLRRQIHHTQAELMLATSPRPEAGADDRLAPVREDVIRMRLEQLFADKPVDQWGPMGLAAALSPNVEALVAAAVSNERIHRASPRPEAVEEAVKAERERCARIADAEYLVSDDASAREAAKAIAADIRSGPPPQP